MSPKKIFKWSSHQSLINASIKILNPDLIVELGVGNFSTPLMNASNADKIIHIENDEQWLEIVQKENKFNQRNDFRYHFLGDIIKKDTLLKDISDEQKFSIIEYYQALKDEILNLNYKRKLLFVDQFTCARALSINNLYDAFDIILYHDAEYPEIYNYSFDNNIKKSYTHYEFRPQSSYTGAFFKHNLVSYDNLKDALKDEFEKYIIEKQVNVNTRNFDLVEIL
jgi:hypothetical protein